MNTTPLIPPLAAVAQDQLTLAHLSRDLLIGVVSGIVTALLLLGFSFLWKRIIEPWFEARVYRGLDVAGIWELENPIVNTATNGKRFDDDETIALIQAAHRLSGTLTFTIAGAATQSGSQDLAGEIKDRLVCFTTRGRSRKSVGYTCVLAEVSADGQRMVGHSVYYELDASKVDSGSVTYVRKA